MVAHKKTSEQLHYGLAQDIYYQLCTVLKNAFNKNPLQFKGQRPQPQTLPKATWINKPKKLM